MLNPQIMIASRVASVGALGSPPIIDHGRLIDCPPVAIESTLTDGPPLPPPDRSVSSTWNRKEHMESVPLIVNDTPVNLLASTQLEKVKATPMFAVPAPEFV